jgi:hypothetical protein
MKIMLPLRTAVYLIASLLVLTIHGSIAEAAEKKSKTSTNFNRPKSTKPVNSKAWNDPNRTRRRKISKSCCGGGR